MAKKAKKRKKRGTRVKAALRIKQNKRRKRVSGKLKKKSKHAGRRRAR